MLAEYVPLPYQDVQCYLVIYWLYSEVLWHHSPMYGDLA